MGNKKPYIAYADKAKVVDEASIGRVVLKICVDELGQVCFGIIDYVPGWFIPLHRHDRWELILVDSSSEGPGYVFFDEQWWRADPGCGVFVPKGCPHAWSSGNKNGFKMLYVYGGSREEAGRVWHKDPETFQPITPEQERNACVWTPGAA